MKRMMHPDHGFHHVYNGTEEANMRAAGWIDEAEMPAVEAEKADEVTDEAKAPPRRTRGPNKPKAG